MAWFDLNSLQQQISQSLGEASELINTVNRLDILNLDEMAVQQEEEEKRLQEEEEEEEEEEDEEGVIDHTQPRLIQIPQVSKSNTLFPETKPDPPVSLRSTREEANQIPSQDELHLRQLSTEKEAEEELARKTQEQLADEWNDSFLTDKPTLSTSMMDQSQIMDDTKSIYSSIGESAVTTNEEVRSGLEPTSNPILPTNTTNNNTVEALSNSLLPLSSAVKKPSIFGKINTKDSMGTPTIEPANLTNLISELPPATIAAIVAETENQGKKKKGKQQGGGGGSKKKKKAKQKKKSLDFFGTSSFGRRNDDEEDEEMTKDSILTGSNAETSNMANEGVTSAGNVGGFGLTALWDDGSAAVDDYVANDDFHIPLPPPSSSSSAANRSNAGDIEAPSTHSQDKSTGNDSSSIFHNLFGTGSATTATSSAMNTIQISNEFLSNLSKKAVTSFFDNIETEIDLEEDPILKQVEWNKKNPGIRRDLHNQNDQSAFSYLNFFPSSTTPAPPSALSLHHQGSVASTHSSDYDASSSSSSSRTNVSDQSLGSQYSTLLREASQYLSSKLSEMKLLLLPFSSFSTMKVLQLSLKLLQVILLLTYYITMATVLIPLRAISLTLCGSSIHQYLFCSYSQEELQSMRVRIRNRIREHCNANSILMGLTAVLFILSYFKFQRYGTDAGD